jgi:pyruvate/2-oxoglutarate dehydrogenase complex dihydrolipoamide dehydrogenase (E3) component
VNYNNIATTVFTPIEYGAIGLSEEDAYNKYIFFIQIQRYGEDNVDCYHTHFKPLEWNFLSDHTDDSCYVKVLVNKLDKDRVVGFHYLGPNAGEVTQVTL